MVSSDELSFVLVSCDEPNLMLIVHRFPDKVRGVFNEGGLFGERSGWHLPGLDTSAWESRELSDGLPGSAAGVGFFVTTFDLDGEPWASSKVSGSRRDSGLQWHKVPVALWAMEENVTISPNLQQVVDGV
ncbi:hypothetical protein CPB85DRAFT_1438584 [Mucidula mucida]|nr:hypothetical protein CPB85DRAFT_1438584 [Mucidula mucida]